MTTKQKKMFFIAALMSTFVVGVGVLVGKGNFSLRASFAKAVGTEYSLSFTKDDLYSSDDTNKIYTYNKNTTNGNSVFLVANGGLTRTSSALATIPSSFDGANAPVLRFYHDASGTQEFRHQQISSLYVKTSGTVTINIQTSSDGYVFKDKGSFSCTTSGASFSSFSESDRFISISATKPTQTRNITELSLTYECTNSIESFESSYSTVVKDKSDRDSSMRIFFGDDHYGFYKFLYRGDDLEYTTLFTWSYDEYKGAIKVVYTSSAPTGSTIEGETASGGEEQYQGYCLFVRNSTKKVYYNYISVYSNQISVIFHTKPDKTWDYPDTYYEHNVRSEATYLTPTI